MLAMTATGKTGRLEATTRPTPQPGEDEVLLRVRACGVCRTDLHVVDGDLPPAKTVIIPGHEIVGIVEALSEWYDIVYCSGRSEDARAATEQWLRTYDLSGPLYMRAEGDIRRDSVVKRELLDRIGEFYDVQAAIDDRQQVVDMWRAAGLLCLQVAPGDF